ncbi:hypothetical protein PR001_g23174 [Phytophthora rubi]|uniref:Uncharacterized protein n=1 Tax=Phytophthora rubi TaxID=129364 RepID=A0A6A3IRC2_9STRA|nr:hypothetical protein PR001_g23174 [Phytophthora rubi]
MSGLPAEILSAPVLLSFSSDASSRSCRPVVVSPQAASGSPSTGGYGAPRCRLPQLGAQAATPSPLSLHLVAALPQAALGPARSP